MEIMQQLTKEEVQDTLESVITSSDYWVFDDIESLGDLSHLSEDAPTWLQAVAQNIELI